MRKILSSFVNITKKIIPEDTYLKIRQIYKYKFGNKEIELTREYAHKISRKPKQDKITIVFVIWMESMWNSLRSVYEEAEKDSKVNAYILAQPHILERENKINQNPAYDFLSKMYPNVINAYENGIWFNLEGLNPDYVFYTYPYSSYYYKNFAPSEVRKFAKICFIQYGFDTSDDAMFYISYNYNFIKNVSIIFATCKSAEVRLKKTVGKIQNKYPKIIYKGFPRFDLINNTKIDTDRKCILWTPRWTVPSKQKYDVGSSFLSYYKNFLNYASNHMELDFIIRPHPLMFSNFLKEGLITQTEIDDFKDQCFSLGNVCIDEGADYLSTINKTDIFVADYSSLLLEFFATGRPVIFLAKAKGFMPEAKLMDMTLYHAFSWKEIEYRLNQLISGNDDMKEFRLNTLHNFFSIQSETIASNIINYIKEDYYEEI